MRLPLPFLLYVTALGLFGWAGWTVYESLPLWKIESRNAASLRGRDDGVKLLAQGKNKGPVSTEWAYGDAGWWSQLKQVNLIGTLPKVEEAAPRVDPRVEEQRRIDRTPLEDVIELVSLVYDGKDGGTGPNTHVIVRYKQGAAVEPPEWWIRENTPPTPGGVPAGPRDVTAPPRPARLTRGSEADNRGISPSPPSALPTSLTGREILQKIWLADDEDPRRTSRLWPQYEHIRLVRVAADAQSAFFVRELPPPKEGEPAPEPQEEELLKTTMNLSQDVLQELRRLQGREGERMGGASGPVAARADPWREVEETTRFGNQFHIGRKDERRFRENADEFFNNVYGDTYVSSKSDLRGLSVRSVQPELATRFGVATGDVLLEINSRKVESKAQAISQVKKDYNRGVRTFTTKWLSNGQVVERVYQAPDQ